MFAHLGLTVAEIALTVLFQVAAPVVLTVLSLVLGPNLRRAAARSSELGKRVAEAVARAREALGEPPREDTSTPAEPPREDAGRAPEAPAQGERQRVDPGEVARARVRVGEEPATGDAQGNEEPGEAERQGRTTDR